ncbi:43261_t:CDS:2, partial [Gigaspora margarita]
MAKRKIEDPLDTSGSGSTSMNEEITDTHEMDQASDHKQDNMQTDEAPHELHAESSKPPAKTSMIPEVYGRTEVNEKLQLEPDKNKENIANMQANMFSQVSNIEPDEFKF